MLVAVVSAVIMVGPGAGAAFAGEVTGNGEPTGATEHANSICVFSGKNDKPDAPLDVEDPGGCRSRMVRSSSWVLWTRICSIPEMPAKVGAISPGSSSRG